ncbi:hypothetical protein CUJ87_31775 (plasmid) [Paraburkholderia caledonica]|nr:hypothetical protein CUJ87_31775 [Paraburkholderia caledonica]
MKVRSNLEPLLFAKIRKRKNAGRGLALNIACATLLPGSSGFAAADQFGVQVTGGMDDHHVRKSELSLVCGILI